jgi:hypothetical protein
MGWKPKEKPLTAEQAIELAVQELTPQWFNSPPLLAGVKSGQEATVHPLQKDFSEKAWFFFFVDPSRYSGATALQFFKEWHRRYGHFNLQFVLVNGPRTLAFRTIESTAALLKRRHLTMSATVDLDLSLAQALGVTEYPAAILLNRLQTELFVSGGQWLENLELRIQEFLRRTDPGLPLPLPYQPSNPVFRDVGEIDFSTQGTATPGLSGNFQVKDGNLVVTDSKSEIRVRAKGPEVAIVLQRLNLESDPGKCAIESGGAPLLDLFYGSDIGVDDEGHSGAKIVSPGVYFLASKLPEKSRDLRIHFPHAERTPLIIHRILFGDQQEVPKASRLT